MTKKVVIIDDSPLSPKLLSSAFLKDGFEVFDAKNAQNAIELIFEVAPDLIVADAIMTAMGGFKFIKTIRADETISGIPIITYSDLDEKNAKFYINESRGEFFLKKDSDMTKIIALANNVIKKFPLDFEYKTNILNKKNNESEINTVSSNDIKEQGLDSDVAKKQKISSKTGYEANFLNKTQEKNRGDLYIAIIEFTNYFELCEDLSDEEIDIFNLKLSQWIMSCTQEYEKIYRNAQNEYLIAIYAADDKSARERLEYIVNLLDSNSNIKAVAGVSKRVKDDDSNFFETQRNAQDALDDTSEKEKVVIKNVQ